MLKQINELLEAIQSVLQGKLPITLINPRTLLNILRNMTLHLPEGYEIIDDTRIDMPLYYQLATVTSRKYSRYQNNYQYTFENSKSVL